MSAQTIIPLFPLAVVAFPGQMLPLHIFESRYKAMIADCRVDGSDGDFRPFGISFGQDTTIHSPVGCSVVVEKIMNEYEDGRLDLITVGQERYRIVEIYEDRPYLTAAVEFFGDEEEEVDSGLVEKAQEQFWQLLGLVEEESGALLEKPALKESFQFAQASGLSLETKQRLLEITSENRRLQALVEHFGGLIPTLRERREEKKRVESNGRSRKL